MHKAICTKVQAQTHIWYCTQTYTIKLYELFTFYVVFGFLHTQKQKHKSKIKCKNNQNNAYKEMHDAQMHDNKASNA